ncbi:hypothetical protein Tco_0289438 [Tanacetum coccineum]
MGVLLIKLTLDYAERMWDSFYSVYPQFTEEKRNLAQQASWKHGGRDSGIRVLQRELNRLHTQLKGVLSSCEYSGKLGNGKFQPYQIGAQERGKRKLDMLLGLKWGSRRRIGWDHDPAGGGTVDEKVMPKNPADNEKTTADTRLKSMVAVGHWFIKERWEISSVKHTMRAPLRAASRISLHLT